MMQILEFLPLSFHMESIIIQAFKGIVHPMNDENAVIIYSYSSSFQTCMNVFVLLNTKEYILKNVGNRWGLSNWLEKLN